MLIALPYLSSMPTVLSFPMYNYTAMSKTIVYVKFTEMWNREVTHVITNTHDTFSYNKQSTILINLEPKVLEKINKKWNI